MKVLPVTQLTSFNLRVIIEQICFLKIKRTIKDILQIIHLKRL